MSQVEVAAANTIKRAIRFNRDRIYAMITKGRHTASKETLVAYICVFKYTDDKRDCRATMGNDVWIMMFTVEEEIDADDLNRSLWLSWIPRREAIITQGTVHGWTSKKIMRMVFQACTRDEFVLMTGWNKPTDLSKFYFPKKYLPRVQFLLSRKRA